jgi:hypothetical protein
MASMKLMFQYLLTAIVLVQLGCIPEEKILFSLSSSEVMQIRDARFVQVSSHDTTGGNNDRINIHAGKTAEIFNVSGPGLITRIWITIDSRDPHFLRRILLRMYWDDESYPSVEVPVGDFFGSPFEYRHFAAENIGMTSGGYYCYFPMPFNNRAKIEIVNETGEEIYAFYYQIGYYQMPAQFDDNTGYFHAYWNREARTQNDNNYVALKAVGNGQFAGINFSSQSYNSSLFYLEGDEMFYVDGEEEPSIYGTGMEDYFTSGWYFKNGEFATDYHGLVMKDGEKGRITAYRHHIRDAIPFKDSIEISFEHGHANEQAVDFSTVAFWYQIEPHRKFPAIPVAGQRIPLRRPVPNGAIEAESLVGGGNNTLAVEDMSEYGSDWSGNKQVVLSPGANTSVTLTLSNLREKTYDVDVYGTKGHGYGKFEIRTSGKNKKVMLDGTGEELLPLDKVTIEDVPVQDGKILLEFISEHEGNKAGIDAFVLTPIRGYIPEWYMIGPFPNPRESDYVRHGLDSVYGPEKEIDLKAKYIGAEGQQVSWERINGKNAGYGMALWSRYNPYEFVVCYALTYVFSPEEKEVSLLFSSDDGSKIFLNNEEIFRFMEVNIAYPDQFEIPLNLKAGWNKLLIKVENNFGGYAFFARLLDPKNEHKTSINAR